MARIRSIKPEFWVSEQIGECSTNARLLFVGLWTFCDDNGVHPAKVGTLKAEVFPLDDFSKEQVQSWIDELIKNGLICEFSNNSTTYWHVLTWDKHQKIDKPSRKHPLPSDEGSAPIRRMFAESSGTESSRVEGSRKEKHPHTPSKGVVHAFPPGFEEFWRAYPRKVGKDAAARAFAKRKVDPALLAQMLAALKRQAPSLDHREGGRFIPHPSTWLNDGRWQDDPEVQATMQVAL